jgi:hypothetical protein
MSDTSINEEEVLIYALELALDDGDFFPYANVEKCNKAYKVVANKITELKEKSTYYD